MGDVARSTILAALVAPAALAACSLLVDTSGLAGEPASDAGAGAPVDRDAAAADSPSGGRPCRDVAFGAPLRIASHSSTAAEPGVTLTSDELTMIFARGGDGGAVTDLFTTSRPTKEDPFGVATPLAINTSGDEGQPSLAPDGLTLFFHRLSTSPRSIWSASRATETDPFGSEARVTALDTGDDVFDPYASPAALYYGGDVPGKQSELFRAPRAGASVSTGVPVVELGGVANEVGPVVTHDELVIYFATDRAAPVGLFDVWTARRPSVTEPFGPPVRVEELASPGRDVPRWLSPDACALYFVSDRAGGAGGYDLYVARRGP